MRVSLVALGMLAMPLFAHKFHVSYTTAEWNAESQALELVLQLFPDDLEAAISLFKGKRVALSRQNEAVIFEYLQSRFEMADAQGKALALTWVGLEIGVDRAWVYLEAPLPQGLKGVTLQQRVFFDLFDDQINSVNVVNGATTKTLVFKRDTPKMLLQPPN